MILEIAANIGEVDGDWDPRERRASAGPTPDAISRRGGIDRPGTKQNLAAGPHDLRRNAHAKATAALDHQAKHLSVGEQVDGGTVDAVEEGRRGIVARVASDAQLVPGDARGDGAAEVSSHRKAALLRRGDEGRRDRRAVADVRQRQDM
jgi:hypothetical protein